MEPEAKLIAAQAAEELARQQATGQVDEIQRARLAQQILGGAAQQAMQREARQQAQDFERLGRLGEVVSSGEREGRLRNFGRNTEKMSGALQALAGGLSAGVGAYADYQAQQELLAKGLQDAEAKGGIAGALKFLEQNPDYDPGEETLQRLYQQSEMGQQDASIDAVERELLQEQNLADIELRRRNERAVEALNRRADDFMRVQAARQLEQDVADDMAMAALKRADREAFRQSQANQIAVDALNRDADRFLLSQELQNFAPEQTMFSNTAGDMAATPQMNTVYIGENKDLPFLAATRALGDPNGRSLREQRLRRLAREQAAAEARARTAMGQSVSDSFPLRSPTLEDQLRLLQALGL